MILFYVFSRDESATKPRAAHRSASFLSRRDLKRAGVVVYVCARDPGAALGQAGPTLACESYLIWIERVLVEREPAASLAASLRFDG